jgi:hypothetical protein
MAAMEQPSHDAMVLAYVFKLAQLESDPMLRAHDLDLIEKAKLLAQRDLMQAEIDRLKGPTLQSVPNSGGDANEG